MTHISSIVSLSLVVLAAVLAAAPASADPGAYRAPDPGASSVTDDTSAVWPDAKDLIAQSVPQSQPIAVQASDPEGSSFQVGDALIGAGIALGLVFVILTLGRTVARERHSTAESQA